MAINGMRAAWLAGLRHRTALLRARKYDVLGAASRRRHQTT